MSLFPSIAAATRCFGQPLKSAIPTAEQMAVAGVELDALNEIRATEFSDSGRRQFLHSLSERGLAVSSLFLPLRRSLYDRDQLDGRIDAIKCTMQFAYELKSKTVTGRIGRVPEDHDSEAYATLVAVLNDIARHANQVGAVFCITPSGDSPVTLTELLSRIDQGPIGVKIDPAAIVTSGQNAVKTFVTLMDFVQQIQIRDAVSDINGEPLETPVGRGEVVWDEFLATIHEADFRGWLTVERRQGDDRILDMTRAVKFVRNLLPG